jgi:hypothetical protein
LTTASHSRGQLSMVNPGMNQVALMAREARKSMIRRDASAPNSPRESGVGVVIPRAMKPDCVSKSNVRQTIWRAMALSLCSLAYNTGAGAA